MILSGSYAMTDGRTHHGYAWATFMVGVVFSLAANILVADPDLISRGISAFPSTSLLLTVEVLIRSNRARSPLDEAVQAIRRAAEEVPVPDLVARLEAALPVETHAMAALLAANDAVEDGPESFLPEGKFWIAIKDAEPLAEAETLPAETASNQGKAQRQPSLSGDLLAQVRALLEADPEMGDCEIGERIDRKPRTATRYRQAVQHELAAQPEAATGHGAEKVAA